MKPSGLQRDLALVSHVLPPSPSGQAMVLRQLLGRLAPESYCLLSPRDYRGHGGEFGESCHWLRPPPRLPELGPGLLGGLTASLNARAGIALRARQIERVVRHRGSRLVVACSGDLWDLPAAALAASRQGIPFIPWLFDDYLYQWTGRERTAAAALEAAAVRGAREVIVPNEFLQREYRLRHGVECTVIRNPARLAFPAASAREEPEFDPGEQAVVYTGSVYHAHYDAFRRLVAALEGLGRERVRLHIYTSQPPEVLRENGIFGGKVIHHPHVEPHEVPRILRQAAVLFLPLAFDSGIPEVVRTSSPGKMGEYLAAERPVLAHVPEDSFVSWYFKNNDCGVVVGEKDPSLLVAALARLLDDPLQREKLSRSARRAAERDFAVEGVSAAFAELICRAMEGTHVPC